MKQECNNCDIATHFIRQGHKEAREEALELLGKYFDHAKSIRENPRLIDGVDECITLLKKEWQMFY